MMNRHGDTSGRPLDPGHLYSALMSESGQHPGAFVPGGNAFSLAHYQNMPNDQVDWAALAQQWIKMRETWIQPMPALIPSPPPPPSFDRDDNDGPVVSGGRSERQHQQQQQRLLPVDQYEEQGEAPMEVERDDDGDMPLPPNPPSISGGWPSTDEPSWRTGWPSATSTIANNPLHLLVPNHLPEEKPLHPHAVQPPLVTESAASAAVALWQAKNSHLFQMGHQKEAVARPPMMTATAVPPPTVRRSFSTQPASKPSSRLPGLMDREIKMGHSGASSSSDGARHEAKENFSGGGSASINEEKRMMLPAWIREGLEKMEREKQQKLKREQERRLWAEKVESQQSRFSLSPTREEPTVSLNVEQQQQQQHQYHEPQQQQEPEPEEAPPKRREKVELKEEDVEKMTKKILTEIFMETTNEVLTAIAKEELSKVQKRKAKQAVTVTTNVGLAAAAGGLGLGIYCDSDEEEEEDEEDDAGGDGRNKKASGADNGSGNGSDQNSSDDDASDSEAMRRMMEKIRIRQQDFKVTAAHIEKWLEDVCDYSPHTAELQRSAATGGSDDGSEDGVENRVADRNADGIDSDLDRDSRAAESPRPRTVSTGNGYGNFGRPFGAKHGGEEQHSSSGSRQEHMGRKRRDKRVSRFSDPRDTVRTTHITHVSILSTPSATVPLTKVEELTVAAAPTATIAPTTASTVRSKTEGSTSRLTAAQRSFNTYFNIPPGQTYQTIYSISGGPTQAKGKTDQADAAPSKESDGRSVYHERKKSPADERDSYHRKRHQRDRSHSRSSHSSRTSRASRSVSADSRTSRSQSPEHQRSRRSRSDTRHSSSSHRRHRYDRDRSSSRGRSRSPRRRNRSKRSRSRSRSRSASKYSSRRRF
uniref:Uncharacterized protein n=1 Tax=Anopheles christyi TaxID=43041 RepID=A0A182KFB8_9DIPT